MSGQHRKIWIITPVTLPAVRRRCPKCGRKTEFVNSGKFRVNGNGRMLDVWLIYKCRECENTWNMSIYKRVASESLNREEYDGFLGNDSRLAARYGTKREVFARNAAEMVEVQGDYVVRSVEAASFIEKEGWEEIEVVMDGALKLRADVLFSKQLGIPRSQVKKLFDRGCMLSKGELVEAGSRVKDGQVFCVKTGMN